MLINGCQEGKSTPRLTEVKCPQCGEYVEVFVIMGGKAGQTGTLAGDETCVCGQILPAGSYESAYEKMNIPGAGTSAPGMFIKRNR